MKIIFICQVTVIVVKWAVPVQSRSWWIVYNALEQAKYIHSFIYCTIYHQCHKIPLNSIQLPNNQIQYVQLNTCKPFAIPLLACIFNFLCILLKQQQKIDSFKCLSHFYYCCCSHLCQKPFVNAIIKGEKTLSMESECWSVLFFKIRYFCVHLESTLNNFNRIRTDSLHHFKWTWAHPHNTSRNDTNDNKLVLLFITVSDTNTNADINLASTAYDSFKYCTQVKHRLPIECGKKRINSNNIFHFSPLKYVVLWWSPLLRKKIVSPN